MQKNILEYLEKTAITHKDKIAFSNGKEGLTFGEIYSRSRSVGSFLSDNGYYREPIAIIMDKHPNTLTAFWGTVYAGCFYACIDEKMPTARILAIFEKLLPKAVICDAKNYKIATSLGIENVYFYDDIALYAENTARLSEIRVKQSSTDAIYVAFTSGSTGTPKGVVA